GRGAAPAARPAAAAPAEAPAPRTLQVGENAFVITRAGDRSVEVTLSPPGIGKLEIEVVLDKGVVNANITAADPAGRDAIERSLPQILETLARDGLAVGGFTVSLKRDGGRDGDAPSGKAAASSQKNDDARGAAAAPVRAAARPAGLVDLFV
ncbi:MAG: flagellar hook-length control protein FliK, partial [Thermodesulfobacteriota bacterium]